MLNPWTPINVLYIETPDQLLEFKYRQNIFSAVQMQIEVLTKKGFYQLLAT